MHTYFPITESAFRIPSAFPCQFVFGDDLLCSLHSLSVQIPNNHCRASQQSWCKLGLTVKILKPHSLKWNHVSNCRKPTLLQQKGINYRQRDTQKHHLLQSNSDKLPDNNRHNGWWSRADWCPWCTIHRSLPVPICLHAVSQTMTVNLEAPKLYVSSGRRKLPTSPSSAGGQEKTVKSSILKQ